MKREKSLVTVKSGPVNKKEDGIQAAHCAHAHSLLHHVAVRPFDLSFVRCVSILTCTPRPTHTHTPLTPTLYLALCLASVATSPWSRLTN
jgi:hypothetical protein